MVRTQINSLQCTTPCLLRACDCLALSAAVGFACVVMSSDLDAPAKKLVEVAAERAVVIMTRHIGASDANVTAAVKALAEAENTNAAMTKAATDSHATQVATTLKDFEAQQVLYEEEVRVCEQRREELRVQRLHELTAEQGANPSKRVRKPNNRVDPQSGFDANTASNLAQHNQTVVNAKQRPTGGVDLEKQAREFAEAKHPMPHTLSAMIEPSLIEPVLLCVDELKEACKTAQMALDEKRTQAGGCLTKTDFMKHAASGVVAGSVAAPHTCFFCPEPV
jgi:hypothetical protein